MITAVIQARLNSTRLPGKVLLPFGDTTVLGSTVRRAARAEHIDRVIVATSNQQSDDPVAKHCDELGALVFRGSLDDVLDRFYGAAKQFNLEHICRVTADCPIIDGAVIDRVAIRYESTGADYASTGRASTTFPDGMDTEIFSFLVLERAWREAKLPSEREHVTPYIWKHPEIFSLVEERNTEDYSSIRLTLDEPQDYALLKNIIANVPEPITMEQVVTYLAAHPEVLALNSSITRDEGYAKSLKTDSTL